MLLAWLLDLRQVRPWIRTHVQAVLNALLSEVLRRIFKLTARFGSSGLDSAAIGEGQVTALLLRSTFY